jgi:hypothetical protein
VPGAQPGDEHVGVEDDLRSRHAGMIYATSRAVKQEEQVRRLTHQGKAPRALAPHLPLG